MSDDLKAFGIPVDGRMDLVAGAVGWGERMSDGTDHFVAKWSIEDVRRSKARYARTSTTEA